jgi:3-dehydroquinate synthase
MAESRLTVNQDNRPIYDIVFENSFEQLGEELKKLGSQERKLCIVTETKVASLYLEEVEKIAASVSKKTVTFVFPEGEAHKNLDTVNDLYECLIENQFDRKDLLVALGGGVTGDLTGFGAATYCRGIDFIQVPTTLLAQVDSSIGGKTGVDFKAYKNMVGAFHMPKLVYMNMATLQTLPKREFNCGLGEIIKHGLIKDPEYLQYIAEKKEAIKDRDGEVLKQLIYGSCQIKKGVVERDPKEQGERALLNFGHTLGHAIEKKMNFTMLHGECVALGCIGALYLSMKAGNISNEEYEFCCDLIHYFDFPALPADMDPVEVVKTTKLDKKMEHGVVKFILLKQLGEAEIVKTVTDSMMEEAVRTIIG